MFYVGGLFLELFAGSLRALYALTHAAYFAAAEEKPT